jgi:radical SAM superfamily enzyme YgiQ (UPF0313 family)
MLHLQAVGRRIVPGRHVVRVLLISANIERINLIPLPLGPALVAAACRQAGHEVSLLNLMFAEDALSALRDCIENFRPRVIGISVRNIDDQNMADPKFLLPPVREVVKTCRNLCDAPIIVGGAGYSIFPESALRYLGADIGIQGEGEAVLPALLDRMAKGAPVSGLSAVYLLAQRPPARTFTGDLDAFPLPEFGSWIPSGRDPSEFWVPVQSRRGCGLDCSFCSTAAIEGRSLRARSPQVVVAWIAQLVSAGFTNFNFVDNTFNLPLSYAKEICRRIVDRRLAINFWSIIYPKWINQELVELMARAGCREISLGFESGSDDVLASLNKKFNAQEVKSVAKMFADAGIFRRGFLLLGGPGETRESAEESLAFADALKLDALKVTMGLRIYPGTPLAATALAEGLLGAEDDLLLPRFYLAPQLTDWLPERIAAYKTARPWVM